MLYQARRWINLGEFLLCYTHYRAIMIEDDRSRTGSALIQGEHILCHWKLSFALKFFQRCSIEEHRHPCLCRSLRGRATINKNAYSVPPFTRSCRGVPYGYPTHLNPMVPLSHESVRRIIL